MKRSSRSFLKWIAFAIAGSAGMWLAWKHYFPKSILHYRLEATFVVDGVPVSGSGVQRLVVNRVRGLGQKRAGWWTFGEAVRVELPGYGAVYLLMTTPTPDGTYTFATKGRFDFLVSDACKLKEKRGNRSWSDYVRMVGEVSGTCQVPDRSLPLMVRFSNELDPETVERVLPYQLEKSFGPNVHFVSATITITDTPLTLGISNHLHWLTEKREKRLTPGYAGSENPSLSDTLKHSYFLRHES
ncbi:hypothetical protein ABLO27_19305 [Roseibium sp. SCPC15]|uniref:hypothetical protein n=1 Tax=Roseibium sp. SCP15 TaxID=3141376 RepID=UPI00333856AE